MDSQYWQNAGQFQNMNQYPQSQPTTYMPQQQMYQNYQYEYVKPEQQVQMQQQQQQQHNPSQWEYPQNSQDEIWKKAQDDLLEVLPMDMGDGQQEFPEGGLLSVPSGEQMNKQSPFIGNNNNNNNGDHFIPPPANPWAPMVPVDPTLKAKVNSEIDKLIIQERNKEYSAKCLGRKEEERKSNLSKAENLSNNARIVQSENEQKERILEYTVNQVLIPFSNDNNCNYDLTPYQNIEIDKDFIEEIISQEKAQDQGFQEKVKKTRDAKQKLTEDEYNNTNKHIPVYIVKNGERKVVSEKTLATRVCRSKKAYETCDSDYKAAAYQYKLRREAMISDLLDRHWNYFDPYIERILTNFSENVWQQAERNGTVAELNYVYSLIFKPG